MSFYLEKKLCTCWGGKKQGIFALNDYLTLSLQAEKNRAAAAANNLQKGSSGPMRLYVGSLHFNITEEMLRGIFEPFGKVRIMFTIFNRLLSFRLCSTFKCFVFKD